MALFGKKLMTQNMDLANGGYVDRSIVTRLPSEYQQFVEQLMWLSIKSTFALNPTNLDDVQIIKSLVDI